MRRAYSLLAVLALWELLPRLGLIRPILLPALSDVLLEAVRLIRYEQFLSEFAITLGRAGFGLALGVIVGVLVGLFTATNRVAREALQPLLSFLFPVPKTGVYPVLIILFGLHHASKVGLVFLDTVFPMIVATYAGATRVNPRLIWSARAMGTPATAIPWRVVLPSALPDILTGIRLAAILSLISAFTAEMMASADGVGHLMILAARTFESAQMFVAVAAVSGAGLVIDLALLWLRRYVLRWHAEAGVSGD